MESKKIVSMFLVVAVMCGGSALGANVEYVNGGLWSNVSNWNNWDLGGVPLGRLPDNSPNYDQVLFGATPMTLTVDAPAGAYAMQAGFGGSNVTLDIQDSLTMSNVAYTGLGTTTTTVEMNNAASSWTASHIINHTGTTIFNMSNGVINNTGQFGISYGTWDFNMSGGTVNTPEYYLYSALDRHDITGGTVYTGSLPIVLGILTFGGSGKMVVSGAGSLAGIEALIESGKIIGQADIVGNTVEITAIPEPVTLLLLGLGGVLLRRKRA